MLRCRATPTGLVVDTPKFGIMRAYVLVDHSTGHIGTLGRARE
jgi:hypothetical protein